MVVIDSPLGGMHYKSEKEKPIMMGKWTMIQAMKRIADNLSPTVIGLRMPVTFDAMNFLELLEATKLSFTSAEVKNLVHNSS